MTFHDLVSKFARGEYTATMPLRTYAHEGTVASVIAYKIYEDLGWEPTELFQKYGITEPSKQHAIQEAFDRFCAAGCPHCGSLDSTGEAVCHDCGHRRTT